MVKSLNKQLLFMLATLLMFSPAIGQVSHSNYIIGYDLGTLNATNFAFEHRRIGNSAEYESVPFQDIRMPTSGVRLEAKTIQDYMIASAGIKARFENLDENDNTISGKFGDIFWMDMAIGGTIEDRFGIYVGGQWKRNGFRGKKETDNVSDLRTLNSTGGTSGEEGRYQRNFFGKVERGINSNLVFNLVDNQVVLRTKYEYNWLKMRGIPGNNSYQFFDFRGRTHVACAEVLTYFSTDEDRDYGLSFSVQYLKGFMESGYREGFEKEDFIPRTDFNQIQFSIGFMFAGRGIDDSL